MVLLLPFVEYLPVAHRTATAPLVSANNERGVLASDRSTTYAYHGSKGHVAPPIGFRLLLYHLHPVLIRSYSLGSKEYRYPSIGLRG